MERNLAQVEQELADCQLALQRTMEELDEPPPFCDCGRCNGEGTVRIDITGVEYPIRCKGYLPAAAEDSWR